MIPFLEKCCCLRLRTGTLIIGYVHMIFALLVILIHWIMMADAIITYYRWYKRIPVATMQALSVLNMMIFSYFLITLFLVYGASKGKRRFLIPFVSAQTLLCVFLLCFELLSCLFLVARLYSVLFACAFLALNVYINYVIVSHYYELKTRLPESREEDENYVVNAI